MIFLNLPKDRIPHFSIKIESLGIEDAKLLSQAGVRWHAGQRVEDFLPVARQNASSRKPIQFYLVHDSSGMFVSDRTYYEVIDGIRDLRRDEVPACLR